jgi:hypothetical protein
MERAGKIDLYRLRAPVAMPVANDFWSTTGQDCFGPLNAFFEYLGLIAGFVLVSIRAEESIP